MINLEINSDRPSFPKREQPQTWSVLGVPIDCNGRFGGCELMPQAMRKAGLIEDLNAEDLGDLNVSISDPIRDPATGIIGFEQVRRVSTDIKDAVSQMLARGERPFVVGGCCTLLLGVCAALREHFPEFGLAFIDGHLDFYDGRSSPTGEAADMELAIIVGRGPAGLINLAGPPPLVSPENIAVIGFRDETWAAKDGAPNPRTIAPELHMYDVDELRRFGPTHMGEKLVRQFADEQKPFWLHLDVDVLDKKVMPAVDYLMPGGLNWEELEELLRPFVKAPHLIGMDITILNPNRDPDGICSTKIVDLLGRVF